MDTTNQGRKMAHTLLVNTTVSFVHEQLQHNDASHDWQHIERMWKMAQHIGKAENVSEEGLEIIDLAALLHDIDDWKYRKEDCNANRAEIFLKSQNVPLGKLERILNIINRMGFKDEINTEYTNKELSKEFCCVQDADRLDAIGAIGIARCFTYGGAKRRPLYNSEAPVQSNLTKEIYMDQGRNVSTINHFHEKLLLLRDKMKTKTGKELATKRHDFMLVFLSQFHHEISGLE